MAAAGLGRTWGQGWRQGHQDHGKALQFDSILIGVPGSH